MDMENSVVIAKWGGVGGGGRGYGVVNDNGEK